MKKASTCSQLKMINSLISDTILLNHVGKEAGPAIFAATNKKINSEEKSMTS